MIRFLILVFLILESPLAFGIEERVIRLQELETQIIQNFPEIRNALIKIEQSREKRLKASAPLDLSLKGKWGKRFGPYDSQEQSLRLKQQTTLYGLGFQVGWRKGIGTFPTYEDAETTPSGELFARAELPLLRDGWIDRIRQSLWSAEIDIRDAQNDFQLQSLGIRSEALRLYWDWIGYASIRKGLDDLLLQIKARQSWIEKKSNAGVLPRLAVDDNLRGQLAVEQTWAENENLFQNTRENVKFFISRDSSEPLVLRLPPNFNQWLDTPVQKETWQQNDHWMEHHPLITEVGLKIDQERLKRNLASNQLFPHLDLYYEQVRPMGDARPTLSRDESKVGLQLSLPLQRSAARADQKIAEKNLEILQNKKNLIQKELLRDHRNFLESLFRFETQLGLLRRQVQINRKLRDAEETFFKRGRSSLLNVNIRERALLQSQMKWIKTRTTYEKLKISFRAFHARPRLSETTP